MASIQADQAFKSIFSVVGQAEVNAANNSVASTLSRVGKSWSQMDSQFNKSRGILQLIGRRQGLMSMMGHMSGHAAISRLGMAHGTGGGIAAQMGYMFTATLAFQGVMKLFSEKMIKASQGFWTVWIKAAQSIKIGVLKSTAALTAKTFAMGAALIPGLVAMIGSVVAAALVASAISKMTEATKKMWQRRLSAVGTYTGEKSKSLMAFIVKGAHIINTLSGYLGSAGIFTSLIPERVINALQPQLTRQAEIMRQTDLERQKEFLEVRRIELSQRHSWGWRIWQTQVESEVAAIKNKFNEMNQQYSNSIRNILSAQMRTQRN